MNNTIYFVGRGPASMEAPIQSQTNPAYEYRKPLNMKKNISYELSYIATDQWSVYINIAAVLMTPYFTYSIHNKIYIESWCSHVNDILYFIYNITKNARIGKRLAPLSELCDSSIYEGFRSNRSTILARYTLSHTNNIQPEKNIFIVCFSMYRIEHEDHEKLMKYVHL